MGALARNKSNQILENKTRKFIPLLATGPTKNELLQRKFPNICHYCTLNSPKVLI